MADNDSQKQRGLDEEAQSSMWAPRCRAPPPPPAPSPLITPRLLEPPPLAPPPRPLALRHNRRAPVPQLVCAMFGATTRFSRWGQVVIWHGGASRTPLACRRPLSRPRYLGGAGGGGAMAWVCARPAAVRGQALLFGDRPGTCGRCSLLASCSVETAHRCRR